MILFRAKKIIFMICLAFLFFTSFVAAEQKEQDINKQYENIVKYIKDNPQQAIKD